jgi:hypothetical protein
MSPALARLLTQLHSARWRARYGNEFEALLIDLAPAPLAIADAVGSAISTRRPAISIAVTVAIAATFIFATHHASRVTAVVQVHMPACAAYSSIPRRSHQCSLG